MKKFMLLLVFMFVGSFAFASNTIVISPNTTYSNSVYSGYKIDNLKNLFDYSKKTVVVTVTEETDPTDPCTVTLTVKVSVTVDAGIGVLGASVTTSASGTITTSCAGAKEAVVNLVSALKLSLGVE